jgi:hypothetical protein
MQWFRSNRPLSKKLKARQLRRLVKWSRKVRSSKKNKLK